MTNSDRTLDIIASIFTFVIFLAYVKVVVSQKGYLKQGTLRVQILATRAAACVPLYAIIILAMFFVPRVYNGLTIPIAVFEGYSFYCFFSLLVTNLGGPKEAVKTLTENEKPLICCCRKDKTKFYDNILWALFHFMVTRVIVVIVTVILDHIKVVYVILSIVAFLILVNAVLNTIIFFENIYEHCKNLLGVSKFLVIKVSVGLLVLEGLIVQILIAVNKISLSDTSLYTGDERAIRIYCFIVLCEYIVIAVVMMVSFSAEIKPTEKMIANPDALTPLNWTYGHFLYELAQVTDVIGKLTVSSDDSSSSFKA